MSKLPNIDPEFIVIIASAWCNDTGIGISYSFDGARFNNRADAIKHGFDLRGSDDFNIGQTYGDDLIWFGWMDERMDEDEDTMREIAESAGLTFDPRWHNLKYSRATGHVIGRRASQSTNGERQ
jgi:hypothetical protein